LYNLLSMLEFQHNSHIYVSTQQCLFILNKDHLPRMGFKLHWQRSKLESIMKFTEQMKSILEEAKSTIYKLMLYSNQRQTPAPVFQPGDKIYLDSMSIHTMHPSAKLSHHCLGPYMVKWVGPSCLSVLVSLLSWAPST